MNAYLANRVPGATWYFTVHLLERRSTLLTEHIAAFGAAIRHARSRKPFHVDAWCALPDHAHAIWTLPPGDEDCDARWRSVKIAFSKALRKAGAPLPPDGIVWERHFRAHQVASEQEYAALVDYVHANPVRHGYCEGAQDWPWSSLHRFVAAGLAPPCAPPGMLALQASPPAKGKAPWP